MTRWTYHGGRLAEASAAFGGDDWLDLSTGINPRAWPDAGALTIDWANLPDEQALRDLEQAAAAYFGVAPDHVCAVPGTEIGLRLLGAILPGTAHHVAPTYRTHGEMFETSTALVFDAMATTDGIIIVANPNNPDGRTIAPETMLGHLERLRANDGWLVVDEAFADANPGLSVAAHIADDRPLIIFRSFGKFFGLAGVRLGFALGPRVVIEQYRTKLGAWPVSAAALAIGVAAYRDQDWIAATREQLIAEQCALDAVLARHGYAVRGDCPLFRLIETDDAAALFAHLARRAILTRPFDDNPRWLRIGLPGSEEALARLDRALGDV